jgi:hypothetical protein
MITEDYYDNINDYYGVIQMWGELKKEIDQMDEFLIKAYGGKKRGRIANCKKARSLLLQSRKEMKEIQKRLLLQEQDYRSDTSDI